LNRPSNPSRVARYFAPGPANRACRAGLSYVEVLIATVIIAVVLYSAVRLFANLGRSSLATTSKDDARFLALQMIEEIKQHSYREPYRAPLFGRETGEASVIRQFYDDVDDYHNWSAAPPQDRFGNDLTRYRWFTRSVAVRYVAANDFTLAAASDEGFKEVTITIQYGNQIIEQQTYVIADFVETSP